MQRRVASKVRFCKFITGFIVLFERPEGRILEGAKMADFQKALHLLYKFAMFLLSSLGRVGRHYFLLFFIVFNSTSCSARYAAYKASKIRRSIFLTAHSAFNDFCFLRSRQLWTPANA